MSDTTPDAAASVPAKGKTPTWLVATISGLVGLFYAYAVWNAIGNLTETLSVAGDLGLTLNALGWFLWIFAAVFPIIVWSAAFALGYRTKCREIWQMAPPDLRRRGGGSRGSSGRFQVVAYESQCT